MDNYTNPYSFHQPFAAAEPEDAQLLQSERNLPIEEGGRRPELKGDMDEIESEKCERGYLYSNETKEVV